MNRLYRTERGNSLALFCGLELLSLTDCVEVFSHATGEDEFRVGLWFIIDQEVQFVVVEPCFSKLVFNGDTVHGKAAAVVEAGFYTVGIEGKVLLGKEHYPLPPL